VSNSGTVNIKHSKFIDLKNWGGVVASITGPGECISLDVRFANIITFSTFGIVINVDDKLFATNVSVVGCLFNNTETIVKVRGIGGLFNLQCKSSSVLEVYIKSFYKLHIYGKGWRLRSPER
jgi:hypothetical protein